MSAVTPALAAFLSEPLLAVIGTRRRDDTVALNPVWFEYRDDTLWLNSYEAAAWPKRVQLAREAALLVIDPADALRVAEFACDLAAIERDGARAHIDELSRRYVGHGTGPHHDRLIHPSAPRRVRSSL